MPKRTRTGNETKFYAAVPVTFILGKDIDTNDSRIQQLMKKNPDSSIEELVRKHPETYHIRREQALEKVQYILGDTQSPVYLYKSPDELRDHLPLSTMLGQKGIQTTAIVEVFLDQDKDLVRPRYIETHSDKGFSSNKEYLEDEGKVFSLKENNLSEDDITGIDFECTIGDGIIRYDGKQEMLQELKGWVNETDSGILSRLGMKPAKRDLIEGVRTHLNSDNNVDSVYKNVGNLLNSNKVAAGDPARAKLEAILKKYELNFAEPPQAASASEVTHSYRERLQDAKAKPGLQIKEVSTVDADSVMSVFGEKLIEVARQPMPRVLSQLNDMPGEEIVETMNNLLQKKSEMEQSDPSSTMPGGPGRVVETLEQLGWVEKTDGGMKLKAEFEDKIKQSSSQAPSLS